MQKILIIGTKDSLFDDCLNLAKAHLFNIVYSSDAETAIYLISVFIPDFILCSLDMDKINYETILNFLGQNPILATLPIQQLTDTDIAQFVS